MDIVELWAYNDDTTQRILHLQWGDTTDSLKVPIPSQSGLVPVARLLISDGNTITASASAVDVITVYGRVTRVDKA